MNKHIYLSSRLPSSIERSCSSGSHASFESKVLLYVFLNIGIDHPKNNIEIRLADWRGFSCSFRSPNSISCVLLLLISLHFYSLALRLKWEKNKPNICYYQNDQIEAKGIFYDLYQLCLRYMQDKIRLLVITSTMFQLFWILHCLHVLLSETSLLSITKLFMYRKAIACCTYK